jgi:carboxyl-terminal processing protease
MASTVGRLKWWVAMTLALGAGCADFFLGEDPVSSPQENFEIFWESFERHYAHFEIKGIDWHDVYDRYRPRVGPSTTDDELFDIFGEMIAELQDGHVYLSSRTRRAYSDWYTSGAPRNFNPDAVRHHYLQDGERVTGDGNIIYGWVDEGIGYIRLRTLAGGDGWGSRVSGWIEAIDEPLAEFSHARGIILDLRSNPGGRAFNTSFMAGRFADGRRPYIVTRSRNGAGYDDFSAPTYWYVKPNVMQPFLRPVVVLTNRYTFSAAEWLTLAMREFPHVTHVGTNTGGGLAMFLPRELPNGWHYTISVQDTRCIRGVNYEIRGITPHIYVENGPEEAQAGKDAILERGMRVIREQSGDLFSR